MGEGSVLSLSPPSHAASHSSNFIHMHANWLPRGCGAGTGSKQWMPDSPRCGPGWFWYGVGTHTPPSPNCWAAAIPRTKALSHGAGTNPGRCHPHIDPPSVTIPSVPSPSHTTTALCPHHSPPSPALTHIWALSAGRVPWGGLFWDGAGRARLAAHAHGVLPRKHRPCRNVVVGHGSTAGGVCMGLGLLGGESPRAAVGGQQHTEVGAPCSACTLGLHLPQHLPSTPVPRLDPSLSPSSQGHTLPAPHFSQSSPSLSPVPTVVSLPLPTSHDHHPSLSPLPAVIPILIPSSHEHNPFISPAPATISLPLPFPHNHLSPHFPQ